MPTHKNKKLALRPETSLANVGNQIAITNKILKSIKDVQLPVFGTFTDPRDGNVYKTVKIGEQVWMAENLRYMPHVCPIESGGGIWVYDYEGYDIEQAKTIDNYKKYGCLYDWETALNVCPSGWHLPTDDEWKKLEIHLGLTQSEADLIIGERGTDQGTQLKGTSGWNSGGNGTNESGFSALPGGGNDIFGSFYYIGGYGGWWSSTEIGTSYAWFRYLGGSFGYVGRSGGSKHDGFSVRCLRDMDKIQHTVLLQENESKNKINSPKSNTNFDSFYLDEIMDSEYISEIRFLELNKGTSKSRLYWRTIYPEESVFHVSNIKNDNGLDSYGVSRKRLNSDWNKISPERTKELRNSMGLELEKEIDIAKQMISEGCRYICYENQDNYVIYIPHYSHRIIGPKIKYSYSFDENDDTKLYLIKTVTNNYKINELAEKYAVIQGVDFKSIISNWTTFLNFLKS
jgi:uncharacterized protein (TIGR02145 family)